LSGSHNSEPLPADDARIDRQLCAVFRITPGKRSSLQLIWALHESNSGRAHFAKPGEFPGLTAVVSCSPYEMTAETQYSCKVSPLRCEDFHEFLMRRFAAYAGVAYNLSQDYHRACARLRTMDLAGTAPVKLARLLWEWSAGGQKSGRGASLHMPFTHGEIGGLKVLAKSGWFAPRPSGTEEIYKIYAGASRGRIIFGGSSTKRRGLSTMLSQHQIRRRDHERPSPYREFDI
jgi:hypothetical protein